MILVYMLYLMSIYFNHTLYLTILITHLVYLSYSCSYNHSRAHLHLPWLRDYMHCPRYRSRPKACVLSCKSRNLLSMMPLWVTLFWFSFFSSYPSTHTLSSSETMPLSSGILLLSSATTSYYHFLGPSILAFSGTADCEWIIVFSTQTLFLLDRFLCGFLWLSQGYFVIKILGNVIW